MRERGLKSEVDAEFAAASVAERAVMADEHEEAVFDPSPTVRAARARSGDLTEEAESVLAGDDSARVRAALASNPACSAEALETLSGDEDQRVKGAVARHPSTPPEALEAMAGELDRRRDLPIARALAGNPRTPTSALEEWLETGTGGWKSLARQALRERAEKAADMVLSGTERLGVGLDEARVRGADALNEALGMRERAAKVA